MMLAPLSSVYRAAVRLRHFLYDHKMLPQKSAPLPVVSIGNVVTGGVGKTQLALLLSQLLSKDLNVAILSRGYRGRAEHAKDPLVVDAERHNAQVCGDEPLLLASRLRSTLVLVNKNRFKSSLKAKELGAQILVLDDGMQHRSLRRDYEIVVIDGKTPFGSFLPKGRLREEPSRLKTADLIFYMGEPTEEVEKSVAAFSAAPQVVAKIVPEGLFELNGEAYGSIEGKKVAIFCGIGNPHRFVKTIEDLGADVVATHFSADHSVLGEKALRRFALLALQRGASLLVCTEKDKVKLLSTNRFPLPICWLKVTLEIEKNTQAWANTINELKLLVGRS